MELNFNIENKHAFISFIPFGFLGIKELLKGFKIKKIERLNIGIFKNNEEIYLDSKNYSDYLPELYIIDDIINYFSKMQEEEYNIYKLNIIFDKISFMYDDDSYIILSGMISSKEDYNFFNDIYIKLFNIYMKSGYLLDE